MFFSPFSPDELFPHPCRIHICVLIEVPSISCHGSRGGCGGHLYRLCGWREVCEVRGRWEELDDDQQESELHQFVPKVGSQNGPTNGSKWWKFKKSSVFSDFDKFREWLKSRLWKKKSRFDNDMKHLKHHSHTSIISQLELRDFFQDLQQKHQNYPTTKTSPQRFDLHQPFQGATIRVTTAI